MESRAAAITTKTSGTGNNPRPSSGFTLIEIVVVLAIMGILLAVAMVGITGQQEGGLLRQEAGRLHALLEAAALEAERTGHEWGVEVSGTGYRFLRFDEASSRWIETRDVPWKNYALSNGVTLDAQVSRPLALDVDTGSEAKPRVLLLSSGRTDAFTLTLSDGGKHMRIESDGTSGIRLAGDHDAP